MGEVVLPYDRSRVSQINSYFCGPASAETVLQSKGINVTEQQLARDMRTHTGGTDHVGLVRDGLNKWAGQAKWSVVLTPNDPLSPQQKTAFWDNLVSSINAGWGVVVNIVAPRGNYPRVVAPSTIPFAYSGGDVYHYVPVMGYRVDDGVRKVWIADSGFYPYGGWISFDQLATLVTPKGYCYSAVKVAVTPPVSPVDELTAIERKVDLILDQLGVRLPVWPETSSMGKDAHGRELTVRDGLAKHIRDTDG